MCIFSCIPAFLHVENVARVDPTTEVEEAEEVYPEEQQQELEVADQATDQVIGPYAPLSAIESIEVEFF